MHVYLSLYSILTIVACNNGDIRLVNGSSQREGRVEVCHDNVYGTVCDNAWGLLDAQVICRYLNFSDAGIIAYLPFTHIENFTTHYH